MKIPEADLGFILENTKYIWEEFRSKTILISGGTGFVGQWLVESFIYANQRLDLNSRLILISRKPEEFLNRCKYLNSYKSITFIKGDIRTFNIPEMKIDFVIHGASEPNIFIDRDNIFETIDVAVAGTKRIKELCYKCKVDKYLFLSSGGFYGSQPDSLSEMSEDYNGSPDILQFSSVYGESKRIAEYLSFQYLNNDKIEIKVARCFTFVAPLLPLQSHYAVGNFIDSAIKSKDILIKGNGEALRSYMYASDMAIWLWTILIKGRAQNAYNVGSNKPITIKKLAERIKELSNSNIGIIIQNSGSNSLAGKKYIPSTQKALENLGLKISIELNEALVRTINYYKNQVVENK